MPKKVLIVEDDGNIAELLHLYLEKEGFETQVAGDGGKGVEYFRSFQPDLVLLDIMLPVMDGWAVLKKIREAGKTPVIMLTARTTESDKVAGLDAGADDYVVKPFSPRELMARVRAVLRRGAAEDEKTVRCGPLTMNLARFSARVDGNEIKLGVLEFRMLWVLASSPGRVYSRSQLLTRVWDDAVGFDERTVDVHILRLRKQLSGTAAQDLVQTVRGVGYKVVEPMHRGQ